MGLAHQFILPGFGNGTGSTSDALEEAEDTFSAFRNQARHHLLSNILRRVIEELLKLQARELLNDSLLPPDGVRVMLLEKVRLFILLVIVLYESPPSINHFIKPIDQSPPQVTA